MTRSRCIFPLIPRLCTLFRLACYISAARHFHHSTGKKVPATIYTVYHRYFRVGYRYPHGTGIPVWTPNPKELTQLKLCSNHLWNARPIHEKKILMVVGQGNLLKVLFLGCKIT